MLFDLAFDGGGVEVVFRAHVDEIEEFQSVEQVGGVVDREGGLEERFLDILDDGGED